MSFLDNATNRAREAASRLFSGKNENNGEKNSAKSGVENSEAESSEVSNSQDIESIPKVEPTPEEIQRAQELHDQLNALNEEEDKLDRQNFLHDPQNGYENTGYQEEKRKLREQRFRVGEEIDADPGVKEAERRIAREERKVNLGASIDSNRQKVDSLKKELAIAQDNFRNRKTDPSEMSYDDFFSDSRMQSLESGRIKDLESEIKRILEQIEKDKGELNELK